jgi:hypothetical protein
MILFLYVLFGRTPFPFERFVAVSLVSDYPPLCLGVLANKKA